MHIKSEYTAAATTTNKSIIIWNNDETIMGTKNPNDTTKSILPNVE